MPKKFVEINNTGYRLKNIVLDTYVHSTYNYKKMTHWWDWTATNRYQTEIVELTDVKWKSLDRWVEVLEQADETLQTNKQNSSDGQTKVVWRTNENPTKVKQMDRRKFDKHQTKVRSRRCYRWRCERAWALQQWRVVMQQMVLQNMHELCDDSGRQHANRALQFATL